MADPHRCGVPRPGAPRIQRIDGADQIVVEADQVLSGIGLISNAGARFEAPETISAQGRLEDVLSGGWDPQQHLEDMALDGVAGEVLYPSQGLFYFRLADGLLMSAIFRAYNDWLAEFCRADPARLKGIAMINLDDVAGRSISELEGASSARPRRHDDHRISPGAPALRPARIRAVLGGRGVARPADKPAHGHATAGQGPRLRRADAARRQQPLDQGVRHPALSMCDLIFSGVFERHPRLTLAIVEFELAWAPHVLSAMDYTYRERHGEVIYRFKDGMRPSDFFRRNVVLSFQEDAVGIRLRDVIGAQTRRGAPTTRTAN